MKYQLNLDNGATLRGETTYDLEQLTRVIGDETTIFYGAGYVEKTVLPHTTEERWIPSFALLKKERVVSIVELRG
jgi:hypothetical protein